MKKTAALCLSILAVTVSCKHNFNSRDLTAYNAVNEGDTWVFLSSSGKLDSFAITKKEIVHYGWNENTGWYSPPTGIVRYKDLPFNHYQKQVIKYPDTIKEDDKLLVIYKTRPLDKPDDEIYFHGFIGTIERDSPVVAGWNKEKVYRVPRFDLTTARDSTDLTYVYWSDNSGIVAYDYKNGDSWTLIRKNGISFEK